MHVSRANGRLGCNAVECVALVILGQGNGFDIADLAVQAGQLAFRVQFELELLAVLELAELFGLFVARQDFMHGSGWQTDFLEQCRERIAFGDNDFAVSWSFWFFGNRSGRRCGFSGLRSVFGAVFDLGER
ncbi:hypothetical protein EMIT0P260_10756 [Pseudomonas sp. IT-P260]